MAIATVSLPDELMERLKALAVQRDVELSLIIQEALEDMLAPTRRRLGFLGAGASV
jgi:predicted transcriptional regulator